MRELAPELGILGIPFIVEPSEFDAIVCKNLFVNIVPGSGTGNIFRSAGLTTEIGQPFGLAVNERIVPGIADPGTNTQILYVLSIYMGSSHSRISLK